MKKLSMARVKSAGSMCAQADASMGIENHGLCRSTPRRFEAGRMAGQHTGDAEELDRPIDRRGSRVRFGRRRWHGSNLYYEARYVVRHDLYGAGTGASVS